MNKINTYLHMHNQQVFSLKIKVLITKSSLYKIASLIKHNKYREINE